MATLFKNVNKLFDLQHKCAILGYSIHHEKDEIVSTLSERSLILNSHTEENVLLLKNWSLPALKPSCAAVVDSQGKITCAFQKAIHTWKTETVNIEKAKIINLPAGTSPIWKVFCCPWDSVLVLFTNGKYVWKHAAQQVEGKKQLGENIWSDMIVTKKGDVVVVMLFKMGNQYQFTSLKFSPNESLTQEEIVFVDFNNETPVSFTLKPSKNNITVLAFTSACNLWEVKLKKKSCEIVMPLPLAHNKSSICAIGSSHIIISGSKHNGVSGLGMWDVDHHVLTEFLPYPEETSKPCQIYLSKNRLLMSFSSAAYVVSVSTPTSALCDVSSKIVTPIFKGPVAEAILPLLDTQKTDSHKKFKSAFTQLMSVVSPDMTIKCMRPVVQRCIAEKQFWPIQEILQLINGSLVPEDMYSELLPCLVSHGEFSLVHQCLEKNITVREEALAAILIAYLECPEQEMASKCKEIPVPKEERIVTEEEDMICENPHSPFSPLKMVLVNRVLVQSVDNKIKLMESLRAMKLDGVIDCLKYIYYLANVYGSAMPERPDKWQACEWSSVLMNAHMSSIIMCADAMVIIKQFKQFYQEWCAIVEEQNTMEGVWSLLFQQAKQAKQGHIKGSRKCHILTMDIFGDDTVDEVSKHPAINTSMRNGEAVTNGDSVMDME